MIGVAVISLIQHITEQFAPQYYMYGDKYADVPFLWEQWAQGWDGRRSWQIATFALLAAHCRFPVLLLSESLLLIPR
jgi:hypothetical protein